jgi:hypothetical protein
MKVHILLASLLLVAGKQIVSKNKIYYSQIYLLNYNETLLIKTEGLRFLHQKMTLNFHMLSRQVVILQSTMP